MAEIFDEDDIPAFLKNTDPNKIIDDLEEDDDFDFPTLDDDEDDLGIPSDEEDGAAEFAEEKREKADEALRSEPPKPEKPKKETKSDKQARLAKPKADPEPEPANIEPSNKRAKPGDNSGVDGSALRSYIERIERLEEEKAGIADDIKDVKAEAKGTGYDGKTIAAILKLRKKDKAERDEEEALLHLYMFALGME